MANTESARPYNYTRLIPYKLAFAFFNGSHAALPAYLALYLRELGFSPTQIGIISSPNSVTGFLGGLLFGYVSPRILTPRNAFTLGIILKTIVFGLMGLVTAPKASEDFCNRTSNAGQASNTEESTHGTASVDKVWIFDPSEVEFNVSVFTVLSCLLGLVYSGNHALLNFMTLEALEETNRNEYGKQRRWGTISHGLVSLFCGSLVSLATRTIFICRVPTVFINYHLVFHVFLVMSLLTVLTSRYMGSPQKRTAPVSKGHGSVEAGPSADYSSTSTLTLNIVTWLLVTFQISCLFGVAQGYLFWHMEDLGASPFIISVSVAVKLFGEFLMFGFSTKILDSLSYTRVMLICILLESAKMLMLALVSQPLLVLLVMFFDGILYSLIKSTQVTYAASVTTLVQEASFLQNIFAAVCCLGKGCGLVAGGLMTDICGAPITFAIFSGITLFVAVIFSFVQTCTDCLKGKKTLK